MRLEKILIGLIILTTSCSGRQDKTETLEFTEAKDYISSSDSADNSQNYFERSLIYRSADSDSLLIDNSEVSSLLDLSNFKIIKNKEYGAGDYYGAYRIYADNLDTLIIDKGDAGEYGFNNSQYLKRKDSVVFFREYRLTTVYGQGIDSIREDITSFKNGLAQFERREKVTRKFNDLSFRDQQFKKMKVDKDEHYKRTIEQLKSLYKLELLD